MQYCIELLFQGYSIKGFFVQSSVQKSKKNATRGEKKAVFVFLIHLCQLNLHTGMCRFVSCHRFHYCVPEVWPHESTCSAWSQEEFPSVKCKQPSAAVRKQHSHRLFIPGCDKLWLPVGHMNVDTHIYATSKHCSHKNNALIWQETASVVALLRRLFSCRWHICSGCSSKRRTRSPAVPSVSPNTVFLTDSLR